MDNLSSERILFPFLGIVISILGKLMIKVKPNNFFGFRLPWTLNNSKSWEETHQYAGRIWFFTGLLFSIISIFLPAYIISYVFVAVILTIIIVPLVYSYNRFGKK